MFNIFSPLFFIIKKNKTLSLSFLFFSTTLLISFFWLSSKGSSKLEAAPPVHPLSVFVSTHHKQKFPIQLELYGTAQAGEQYSLKASTTGKVIHMAELYPGKKVVTGEILLQLENDTILRRLQTKKGDLKKNNLELETLQKKQASLEKEIPIKEKILSLTKHSLEKKKEKWKLEEELFFNYTHLFDNNTLSKAELNQKKSLLLSSELDYLQTQEHYQNKLQENLSLLNNIEEVALLIKLNKEHTLTLNRELLQVEEELSKTTLTAPSDSQIVKINVNQDDEVTENSPLITLQKTKYIDLNVSIPDTHLRWLYENETFWQEPSSLPITLTLVNNKLDKCFSDPYIQSCGPQLETPSRSLPLLIRRYNPTDQKDHIIPGMYCKVGITLHELSEVFIIPESAIQNDGALYLVENEKLKIIDQFEILLENKEGYIVKYMTEDTQITIIPHFISGGYEGMPLHVEGEVSS